MRKKSIYLDGGANTPLDHRVLKAMRPFLRENFQGNSFAAHDFGIKARMAVEDSRVTISKVFHVNPGSIYFTSGATESNNMVIQSLTMQHRGGNILCSAIEHSSVFRTCKALEDLGLCSVTYLTPDKEGRITAQEVKKKIQDDTFLCCVMSVNNETGIRNEVQSIGSVLKKKNAWFLCDCTQLLTSGYNIFNLSTALRGVDYVTFSGHKIYGPTGVGCLIVLTNAPVYPLLYGGSQENGKRGGTSNTAGIVGLGEACRLLSKEYVKILDRNMELFTLLMSKMSKIGVVSSPYHLWGDHYGIVSLDFSSVFDEDNLAATMAMYNIAVSAGSACDSQHSDGSYNPSHVLTALGKTEKSIRNTVRVSFTKHTRRRDINAFVKIVKNMIKEKQGGKSHE